MTVIARPEGYPPGVGALLSMMQDCRRRTLEEVARVDPALVDAPTPWTGNTIGALLYHIAAIELDWLFADILQTEFPADAWDWFPHDVREEGGRLTPIPGEPLERHLDRLAWVRRLMEDELRSLTDADLAATRPNGDDTVTVEWILHHLMQHEAEHRGQLGEVRTALST